MENVYVYETFTALFLFSHFSENHRKLCHEPSTIRDQRLFKVVTLEELYLPLFFQEVSFGVSVAQ